jgi:hypothetical protein
MMDLRCDLHVKRISEPSLTPLEGADVLLTHLGSTCTMQGGNLYRWP